MAKKLRVGGRKPGVLNRHTVEIRELARSYGPEAVDRLVTLMRTAKSQQVRIMAIRELLDRGYGKSPLALQGFNGGGNVFVEILHFAEEDGKVIDAAERFAHPPARKRLEAPSIPVAAVDLPDAGGQEGGGDSPPEVG